MTQTLSKLDAALKELFNFLDTAKFNDLPVLNLPTVKRLEAVREAYEEERHFSEHGGGCGFSDYKAATSEKGNG